MANKQQQKIDDSQKEDLFICDASGALEFSKLISQGLEENDVEGLRYLWANAVKVIKTECQQLGQKDPRTFYQLSKSIAKAQWRTLASLTTEQIENLFHEHFEFFFDYDWKDVLDKLRSPLIMLLVEERDKIKAGWRKALAASWTLVGEEKISIADAPVVAPTIGAWLKDYRVFLKERKENELLLLEYLNTSANVIKQSGGVREKISSLLHLDFELSKSSLTHEGQEELIVFEDAVSGNYKILDRGETRDTGVKIPESDLKEMREILGLDEQGKPLSPAKLIKKSVAEELAMGIVPEEVSAGKPPEKLPTIPTQKPQPRPKLQPARKLPPQDLAIKSQFTTRSSSMPKRTTPVVPSIVPSLRRPQPTKPQLLKSRPITTISTTPETIDYELIAKKVLSEHKLLFPSLDEERRFNSIIVSYLTGAQDREKIMATLIMAPEAGGVHLSKKLSEQVLDTADKELDIVKQFPFGMEQGRPKLAPTLEEVAEQIKREKLEQEREGKKEEPKEEPVEDILASTNPVFGMPIATKRDLPLPQVETSSPPPSPQSYKVGMAQRSKKVFMRDVIAPQQIQPMGPVEELGNLTLLNFRRLAPDPSEAVQKIIYKLQLLGEESVNKRAQGIEAWYASPLNQLYLAIGQESLEKGVAVAQVISERTNNGQETLTEREFNAISDLNHKLIY